MAKAPKAAEEKEIMSDAMSRVAEEQIQDDVPAPRRKAASKKAADPYAGLPKAAMTTYTPLDEGDWAMTPCHGYKFKANVPVKVTKPEMIKCAMTNPWFKVEGYPQAQRVLPPTPRDASQDARSVDIPAQSEVEMAEVTEDVD